MPFVAIMGFIDAQNADKNESDKPLHCTLPDVDLVAPRARARTIKHVLMSSWEHCIVIAYECIIPLYPFCLLYSRFANRRIAAPLVIFATHSTSHNLPDALYAFRI